LAYYALKYPQRDSGELQTVEFDADTPSAALRMAKELAENEWAELYEEGRPLCRIQTAGDSGVWRVASIAGKATPKLDD